MAPSVPVVPDRANLALRRIATIAFLAVILGFAIQGLILGIQLSGGPWGSQLLVDVAGGVTWSVLVCTGVGLGAAIANGRPLMTGLLAFVVAPIALAIAKGSQKVMTGWLGAVEKEAVLSLGTVSILRAIEYGLLGWLLGRLVQTDHARSAPYLGSGLAIGIGFGGPIAVLTWLSAAGDGLPLTQTRLAVTIVSEVIFPVGCALVIYLGQDVGRHLRIVDSAQA